MTPTSQLFESRCRAATCRGCETPGLTPILDLGPMPPSDRLVSEEELGKMEPRFPLDVAFCDRCSLVQILETVPPDVLFSEDYLYFSSFSDALLRHSRQNAMELIDTLALGPSSLVIEPASNDGYMLKNFADHGIEVLGIDPAPKQAEAARKAGVNTLCDFFGVELARDLAAQGTRADLVIANNVLAHVADTNGFVEGIATVLRPDGVVSIEVPYIRDLVDKCEFDTIYHEHLCYFSVTSADRLLRRHGLHVHDVRRLPIHGGSLRLYASRERPPSDAVHEILSEEHELGLDRAEYYRDFSARVQSLCRALYRLLHDLDDKGSSLAAYGAAAKGAILLNTVGVGSDILDFVADRNVHKRGRYMPGASVPIVSTEELLNRMPDYVLLLAWNFRDEILEQQAEYRRRGGRFIVPVPRLEVV